MFTNDSGIICLPFAIDIPEIPILINSVKKSAILCLGYSFSVFTSAKVANHPLVSCSGSFQFVISILQ